MENNYVKERTFDSIKKINEIKKKLPFFCNEYFVGIENRTTALTRLNYARDLLTFFEFLTTEVAEFYNKDINCIEIEDLNKITISHIELYMTYLNMYKRNDNILTNKDVTKSRKISALRSMLKYFYRKGKISENVGDKVVMPKIREKEIVRLEVNEVSNLLETVESGENLIGKEQSFHKHTAKRDIAIMTLFLGTGIRVSELVGLNIDDIDFENNAFMVTRKGEKRAILYFSDEVKDALDAYLEERIKTDTEDDALFLSMQNKRLGVRAVEKLVKKYASKVTPLKRITPHKLRSTYGTNLYKETNDIYVVAEVLGHNDINTTKKHYAAISEDIKRNASNKVKLRKETD